VIVTRSFARVLFDSSAIITFVQAEEVYRLSTYIGAKGAITLDVEQELLRLSQMRFPGLIALERLGWPPGDALTLPPHLLQEAEDIRRVELAPGAHENKDRGEVSTALMTQHLGNAVAVMEDAFGKRICARRKVPRVSTAQLAAEMVAAEALEIDSGFVVYDHATPDHVGSSEFESAVEGARRELAKSVS
jgi:hypothetical protein